MFKQLYLSILVALVALVAVGQVQQGVVKTRGRMVGGKLVPGQGLPGAVVTIQGRNAIGVKNANGSFSFAVQGGQFMLKSVTLAGYKLVDAEAAPRAYRYGPSPLTLLLDKPEQQSADKLAYEKRMRRNLEAKLHDREDELEALRESNRITLERYNQAMQELYAAYESDQMLIREMAQQYVCIDFDSINEANREISDCIVNGRLEQADSLLRRKGDINLRIQQANRHRQANQNARHDLENSEELERKNRENIAQDCYFFFQKFVIEGRQDSAAAYIERRANLDPAVIRWQIDAASYFQKRGDAAQAQAYYQRAIDPVRQLAADSIEAHIALLAMTLNNVALLHSELGKNDQAQVLFAEANALLRRLGSQDAMTYLPYYASTLNNLAMCHMDSDFEQSEALLSEAIDVYYQLAKGGNVSFMPEMASAMNNLGLLYAGNDCYDDSEELFTDALEIYERLEQQSPELYQQDIAATLGNLATLYFKTGNKAAQALDLQFRAVDIWRRLVQNDSALYVPKLAAALTNVARQLYELGRDGEAGDAVSQAIEGYRFMAENNPYGYKPRLAELLFNQGIRCFQAHDMDMSESLLAEALAAYRHMDAAGGTRWKPQVAMAMRNLARVYDLKRELDRSAELYNEELAINLVLMEADPARAADVARSYGNLSNHALLTRHFDRAIEFARQGIACDSSKRFILSNLAAALLFSGRTEEAMEIYRTRKAELASVFMDDFVQFADYGIIPPECEQSVAQIKQMLAK